MSLSKEKKVAAFAIIILVVLSTISLAIFFYEEIKYDIIKKSHNDLEQNYNELTIDYNDLQDNYNELNDNFNELSNDFDDLAKTIEYMELPIDHLMEMTYANLRDNYQPQYSGWWGNYYYNKNSAEYASYIAAHDLGRRYWPDVENKYEEITGTSLPQEAYNRMTDLIDFIDISNTDSNTEKIRKILDFITTWITYQSDINNEFLFPMETITFRSGDCDDFSILAATLFEKVGIDSAIGLFQNNSLEKKRHSMVLVHLNDLEEYGYWYYNDLTNFGLSSGKWIILEPQATIDRQTVENWIQKWGLIAAAEVPNN